MEFVIIVVWILWSEDVISDCHRTSLGKLRLQNTDRAERERAAFEKASWGYRRDTELTNDNF